MALPPPRSQPQVTGLPIEISPDLSPIYANLVRIAHSTTDFVLDFARFLPGESKASVLARVVLSPLAAKLLLRALTENISRYENTFGVIAIPVMDTASLTDNLFRPPHPPEGPPAPSEPPSEPPQKPPQEPA